MKLYEISSRTSLVKIGYQLEANIQFEDKGKKNFFFHNCSRLNLEMDLQIATSNIERKIERWLHKIIENK